jgi:hypothetical protein
VAATLRKRIGVVLGIACALLLGLMAASSIYESVTPPEVALSRTMMSEVPPEQYSMRWVDDRPFVGERSLVVSVPGRDRADLPLQFPRETLRELDGCGFSIRDVDQGVEIAIWCGGLVTTGSESEI